MLDCAVRYHTGIFTGVHGRACTAPQRALRCGAAALRCGAVHARPCCLSSKHALPYLGTPHHLTGVSPAGTPCGSNGAPWNKSRRTADATSHAGGSRPWNLPSPEQYSCIDKILLLYINSIRMSTKLIVSIDNASTMACVISVLK